MRNMVNSKIGAILQISHIVCVLFNLAVEVDGVAWTEIAYCISSEVKYWGIKLSKHCQERIMTEKLNFLSQALWKVKQ